MDTKSVAVFIPCLDEEKTIGKVVRDFINELPNGDVIVVDNDSNDRTVLEAQEAGATVISERRRGKGFVVQTIFQAAEADIVVIVDGDDTYPAAKVHEVIEPVLRGEAEMSVGSRTIAGDRSSFRRINLIGNIFYQRVINLIFRTRLTDVLSGYRAFSDHLVKNLPIFVTGFEVEAELTIKCLQRGYRIVEVPVELGPRPSGSTSKIRILRDGFRILATIMALIRDYKPLTFFGTLGLFLVILGTWIGVPAIQRQAAQGLELGSSSIILGGLLFVMGLLLIAIGLILHTINRRFQELEHYLRAQAGRQRVWMASGSPRRGGDAST